MTAGPNAAPAPPQPRRTSRSARYLFPTEVHHWHLSAPCRLDDRKGPGLRRAEVICWCVASKLEAAPSVWEIGTGAVAAGALFDLCVRTSFFCRKSSPLLDIWKIQSEEERPIRWGERKSNIKKCVMLWKCCVKNLLAGPSHWKGSNRPLGLRLK